MNRPPETPRQCAAGLGSDDRTEDKSQNDTAGAAFAQLIRRRRAHLAVADGLSLDGLLDLARRHRDRGRVDEAVWTLRLLIERVQGVRQ